MSVPDYYQALPVRFDRAFYFSDPTHFVQSRSGYKALGLGQSLITYFYYLGMFLEDLYGT